MLTDETGRLKRLALLRWQCAERQLERQLQRDERELLQSVERQRQLALPPEVSRNPAAAGFLILNILSSHLSFWIILADQAQSLNRFYFQ